jgi:hypothetical protein
VRVQANNEGGAPRRWLPTDPDQRLLKQETAARLITQWELSIQVLVLDALRKTHAGGTERFTIDHPIPEKGLIATLTLTIDPVREPDYSSDDIVVEIDPVPKYAGQHLLWQLTIRVLTALSPPEQDWDRLGDTFSNITEPGSWTTRVTELEKYAHRHQLAASKPGQHSHYTHRGHIAGSTIEGSSMRALCGAYFVPCQDHTDMPVCPECQRLFDALPK